MFLVHIVVARVGWHDLAFEMSFVFLKLLRRPGAVEVIPPTVLTDARGLVALLAAFAT